MFLGYALYAGVNLEGWHNGCRHWGVGNDGRIRNLLKKTQYKGSYIYQTKWKNSLFPVAYGRIKFIGGDQELRTSTLIRKHPSRGEGQRDFLEESEGSPPSPPQDSHPDAGEAINDFWSMSGNFKNRHHVEPRVKLYSPREESFPIPIEYIAVSRTTHTNLDVMQESRIDDSWNIDGWRDLSDSWTGFTQFALLNEKPPDGFLWSGEDWQNGKRHPDYLWPKLWTKLARNTLLREKQKCVIEKPKLDNARRLRGINFIDPEDKEFKGTIRNAWKMETPMAPAMPCKTCKKSKNGETRSKTNDFKSKFACILDASESTRMRKEESLPKYHEDHIAGRGDNSLQHYNLVHKFILMPQAMKIPAAKAAVDKDWEKLEKIPAWDLRTKDMKVHFASLMDICHLKNAELETKHQKYKGRVVLRGDIVEDDSGSYAVFTEQGSSASQMTAAKVMDMISRLPGCAGQAADAVSAYTQVKNGRCSKSNEHSQNRNVHIFGFVYHDTNGQNHGPVWKTQSFLLSEICTVILWKDYYWKGNLKIRLGEGFQWGMIIRTPWKRITLICVCGWHQIGWKETKLIGCGKY